LLGLQQGKTRFRISNLARTVPPYGIGGTVWHSLPPTSAEQTLERSTESVAFEVARFDFSAEYDILQP